MNMIDTPSPFASLEEWVSYRESLQSITDHDVSKLIQEADDQIVKMKGELNEAK